MSPLGVRPKQSLGQNFLVDPNIARQIVQAFQLRSDDIVVEIGPGFGILTELVLPQVSRLVAVEIDSRLIENLRARFSDRENFVLLQGDFLKKDLDEIVPGRRVRIIGNIPYNITSPIFFQVVEHREKVIDLTLLVQREVAWRIVASPNSKDYGILSVISQTYADVETLLHVPRTVFRPKPKVESTLVRWRFTDERARAIIDHKFFRQVVRQAFNQRRKMLRNSLKNYLADKTPSIDVEKRPEQLGVSEWIRLANELAT